MQHYLSKLAKLLNKTNKLLIFLILSLTSAFSYSQAVSGTFTINSAVATGGTNFQSFSDAVDFITPGVNGPVVFNVAPNSGSYFEQIVLSPILGASAINTITFNGNGNLLEFASTNSNLRAGIMLDGADHIIIDSINVTAHTTNVSYSYGWGIALLNDADSNIIRKCTVHVENNTLSPQNTYGILITSTYDYPGSNGLSNCDGNIITQNTIIGGDIGIVMDNYAGNITRPDGTLTPITTMNNNKITNNTISGFIQDGMLALWTGSTLIEGNDISISMNNGNSVNAQEYNAKLTISKNKIHNSSSAVFTSINRIAIGVSSIKAEVGNETTVVNNLIYNFNTPGDQTAIYVSSSTSVNIYHNTISMDDTTTANSGTVYGISIAGTNTSINVFNNNVAVTTVRGGTKYAIYSDATNAPFISNNNNFYNKVGNLGRYNSSSYTTLAKWQAASGKDYRSVSMDPVFTNPATVNFKPTAPALDNLGTNENILTDITGATRNNTAPDMGAYEFLSVPCSTPPIAGIANPLPGALLCAGSPITLTASGNSGGLGQTYQWQTSATLTGTYTNYGGVLTTPPLDGVASSTLYYRLQATCATAVAYSAPILITANSILQAGTYTINKTLPTAGTNYASFADLLTNLTCGIAGPIVLNVAPSSGPYNEQVLFTAIPGSSTTNTLTINGNGQTLSFAATASAQRATIRLTGASNIIIDSLNIVGTGATYGYGVQLNNNSDNNIIRNCTITVNTTGAAVTATGVVVNSATDADGTGTANLCDNNIFSNNTITGGYYGLTLAGSTSAASVINNNQVINNRIRDFYGSGIYVNGTFNTLVEGNDISRPTRTNSNTSVYGISIPAASTSLKVSKNRIHNLYDANLSATGTTYGIYSSSGDATSAANNIFCNNVIYNFNGATSQGGIANNSSDYSLYYHNTISLDDTTATVAAAITTRGFYQTTAAVGLQFKDNIVTITRRGLGVNHGIYLATTTTTYTADNNDYYIASTTGTNYTAYASATNYATLANWQTASAKETNTLAMDPVYTSMATGNLKPTVLAMDNKGVYVNIATDILGISRSITTPDMGAFEFNNSLPIKLVDISATKMLQDVVVNWSTATETNSSVFIIERSVDGTTFTNAGTVSAAGNSTSLQQYNFNDKYAAATNATSKILYYRIKSVDKDGSFEYSKIVSVNIEGKTPVSITVFPNPFVNSLYLKIVSSTYDKAVIKVMDIAGKLISNNEQATIPGVNMINIPSAPILAKGTYLVSLTLGGEQYTLKVVK